MTETQNKEDKKLIHNQLLKLSKVSFYSYNITTVQAQIVVWGTRSKRHESMFSEATVSYNASYISSEQSSYTFRVFVAKYVSLQI